MAKNKLRNPNFVLFMDSNRNSFSIISNFYVSLFLIDLYFQLIHFFISLIIIWCIYKNLIEYFIKTWCICNLFILDSHLIFWKDPFLLFCRLNCTNISIRSKQDVLKRSFLLINLLDCLLLCHFILCLIWQFQIIIVKCMFI